MKSQSDPIRVMIVDDHLMVRRGLATFLKVFKDFKLVGEADSGESAVQLCVKLQPDVVLMDMVMQSMDGGAATRLIRKQCPSAQIIALTSFKDDILVKSALQAGAISYLLKGVSANELAQAIRAAHAGRSTISAEATEALIQAASQEERLGPDLTEREHEVLLLMVEGLNNTQIASKLTVSPSTIKSHVSSILAKLGVASRTEAVALALRHKLAS
ncbi:MAG TPA: response regulator transcription factor [Anaerolineales bacterium]|nr:response regulator transcription factor [Anaerolineales bacterium]